MPLTDIAIRAAKPLAKPVKLTDGGGLHLLVTPTGGKLWRLAYRFDGKQKQLAFGGYPEVSLKDARAKRDAAKEALAAGFDPSTKAKVEKLVRKIATANTFDVIADEYLERLRDEERAAATLEKVQWLLGFARPSLGKRPISEISAVEVLAVLRTVEQRGRYETARRLRSTIGTVFRYAISTARADSDPTSALRGALTSPKVKHRAAITDAKGFGAMLCVIDGFEGQPTTLAALKLMALLFPRPGELRMAEWSEFDLDKTIWAIPAERMKMRRAHRTPLPAQALAVLRDLQAITGRGRLLFPCVRTTTRPISENTLNAALRRLGYDKDQATAHGFRATASTILNQTLKWHPDVIERQLAHVEGNDVRRAYDRGDHWDERVKMMAWWADHLDALRTGAKVIPLDAGRTQVRL
ncbi:integrase arm-type DNA-binding domain-containing protein [Starkeya sp. ORNL1]|uniref:tyrosine-type recombinase/integrase n=1 Tax=Starkeya sp. ORNL1 TaxID=2709380 RepID=UPI0014646508|nr:integrase arm-type DNA-binding domain-containing protein [Starkeya sp. ORNL1]QJP14647.1 integrase arm-type DNA-binding domain-containing protein [Starkeya sp. ORNL1]